MSAVIDTTPVTLMRCEHESLKRARSELLRIQSNLSKDLIDTLITVKAEVIEEEYLNSEPATGGQPPTEAAEWAISSQIKETAFEQALLEYLDRGDYVPALERVARELDDEWTPWS